MDVAVTSSANRARKGEAPHFVFLVHPRTLEDVLSYFKLPMQIAHSRPLIRLLDLALPLVPNQTILKVKDTSEAALRGAVIALPFTTEMLQREAFRRKAVKHIQHTIERLDRRGVQAVGLGALLSSVTQQGKHLSLPEAASIRIATGRLLTVYNVATLYDRVARELYGPSHRDLPITVLGAAGSIGSGTSLVLASRGYKRFVLVDLPKKAQELRMLSERLREIQPAAHVCLTHEVQKAISSAFGIVTATSRPDSVVPAKTVKPGTFIVDDAQPSDVDPLLYTREDVVVVSGGAMYAPFLHAWHPLFSLAPSHIFSCLAETYVFARYPELADTFQPARLPRFLSPSEVERVGKCASSLGILPGELHNPKKHYTKEELVRVGAIGSKRSVEPLC